MLNRGNTQISQERKLQIISSCLLFVILTYFAFWRKAFLVSQRILVPFIILDLCYLVYLLFLEYTSPSLNASIPESKPVEYELRSQREYEYAPETKKAQTSGYRYSMPNIIADETLSLTNRMVSQIGHLRPQEYTKSPISGYREGELTLNRKSFVEEVINLRDRNSSKPSNSPGLSTNRDQYKPRYFEERVGASKTPEQSHNRSGKNTFKQSEMKGYSGKISMISTSPYKDYHLIDRSGPSIKKGTISKRSIVSVHSNYSHSRYNQDYYSNSDVVRDSLNRLMLNHKLFNAWTTKQFKIWIKSKLSVEILKRNQENFRKIKDVLSHFNMALSEYEDFCNNSDILRPGQPVHGRSSEVSSVININRLLNCFGTVDNLDSNEWMASLDNIKSESFSKIKEISKNMKEAIEERIYLDLFFRIQNYTISQTREFILARLTKYTYMEENNEFEERAPRFRTQPSDSEIQLSLFFNYIFENHPDYSIEPDFRKLFYSDEIIKPQSAHFSIKKVGRDNYTCFSKGDELNCYAGPNNIYCVMAYFMDHIKVNRHTPIEKWTPSLLTDLYSYFTLRSDEYIN